MPCTTFTSRPLSTTETALTAHIVTAQADDPDGAAPESARNLLHDRFHIEHCTIQVERHHAPHHSDRERHDVTHLECSLTGERYEAGDRTTSAARKLLLVRYDLEAAKRTLNARQPGEPRAWHVEVARAAAE